MVNKYFISVHSLVDYITSSSTETFIVDSSKVEESFKEIFRIYIKENKGELDYETTVQTLEEYESEYNVKITFKDSNIDPNNIYVIDASYHNELLNHMINNYFNPINDYAEEYVG